MHGITLLQDLAVVMAVAAVITVTCHRLRIPVVLGYILAGVLIGPHTPPYALVSDPHSIEILSELGVVFLLFSIGLEFSLSRLMKVGVAAFMGAVLEIAVMIPAGYFLGRAFGWGAMDSLFLGAILSISSTTIIAKVLIETKRVSEKFAQVILGILIIEDLLAIVLIAVLSGLAETGTVALDSVLQTAGRVGLFTVCAMVVGFLAIPRLLRYLEKIDMPETLVVSVLGLCFAGALAAALAGFSVALGAFLVGAIMAETKQIKKVIHQVEPIRDMFTAVFFVSVGMMIQPSLIAQYWVPILVISLVTIAGKVFSCSLGAFLAGHKPETALMAGLGLAQIGEFSFIIAGLGQSTQVTSSFLYPITVSVSAITTLTTPFLLRSNLRLIEGLKKVVPQRVDAFLGLYTSWVRSVGRHEKPKRALFGQLLGAGKVQQKIERVIADIVDLDTAPKNAPADLAKFIREEYPWEVETVDFLVPLNDSALNQKLSELRLRSATGATVVGIYRDDLSIPNPSADTVIAPGDVLLILGDKEQIRAAVEFLQNQARRPLPPRQAHEGVPRTRAFQVTAPSVCAGKTIEELKLKRRSGATILGLQKGEQVIHNPKSEVVIEEGDTLMLFGWPEQLDAAVRFLSGSPLA